MAPPPPPPPPLAPSEDQLSGVLTTLFIDLGVFLVLFLYVMLRETLVVLQTKSLYTSPTRSTRRSHDPQSSDRAVLVEHEARSLQAEEGECQAHLTHSTYYMEKSWAFRLQTNWTALLATYSKPGMATLFRYGRNAMKLMAAIGIVAVPLLLPINYTAEHNNDTSYGTMIELSAQDIDTPSPVLWAHFVVTLLFSYFFAAWAIGTARSIRGRSRSWPEAIFVGLWPGGALVRLFTWTRVGEAAGEYVSSYKQPYDDADGSVGGSTRALLDKPASDTLQYMPAEGHESENSAVLMLKGNGWHAYSKAQVEESLRSHFEGIAGELGFAPAWICASSDARDLQKLYQQLCVKDGKVQSLKRRGKDVTKDVAQLEELRAKVKEIHHAVHGPSVPALDFAFVGFETSAHAQQYLKRQQEKFTENVGRLPANVSRGIQSITQLSKSTLLGSSSRRRELGWEPVWAPASEDILWTRIGTSSQGRALRWVLWNAALLVASVTILTPVVIISQLQALIESAGGAAIQTNPGYVLVSKYLPPLIYFAINAVILPILIKSVANRQGVWTKSEREVAVLWKAFTFLLFNTLILPSLALTSLNALIHYLAKENDFTKPTKSIFQIFSQSLLSFSGAWFCRYLATSGLIGGSFRMLALPAMLATGGDMSKLKQKDFEYGWNTAEYLVVLFIGVLYSVATPIILPFVIVWLMARDISASYILTFFQQACHGKDAIASKLPAFSWGIQTSFQFMMGIFFLSKNNDAAGAFCFTLFAIGFLGRCYFASRHPKTAPAYAFDRCSLASEEHLSQLGTARDDADAWDQARAAYTAPCLRKNAFTNLQDFDEDEDDW
mmetsp:Transcript_1049/g.3692  ORF Transcript_1049/g.3692 Transcript_1049/m.3692 type:complete len:836 (-) Transcript_1049:2068-4575(-)